MLRDLLQEKSCERRGSNKMGFQFFSCHQHQLVEGCYSMVPPKYSRQVPANSPSSSCNCCYIYITTIIYIYIYIYIMSYIFSVGLRTPWRQGLCLLNLYHFIIFQKGLDIVNAQEILVGWMFNNNLNDYYVFKYFSWSGLHFLCYFSR